MYAKDPGLSGELGAGDVEGSPVITLPDKAEPAASSGKYEIASALSHEASLL